MDLGILTINTLDEISVLSTTANRIQSLTYGYHWSALDHIFGEVTAVGMSAAK